MKSVLYIQHTDPAAYPPLERSAWLFADRGWKVRFLGIQADEAARSITMAPAPQISVELLPKPRKGLHFAASYLSFLAKCRIEILRWRPDVVYCSDLRSYPAGLWASYRPKISTVLHEHDTPFPDGSHATAALLELRRRFAMRSSLCVIPQDQRASDFKQATGAKRLAVAYNCPSLREVRSIRRHPHSPELVLWYHGSIGPKRLPKNIIRALSRARVSVRLEIAGYETLSGKGYIAHIMSLAAELGISNYVRFHGALCREQLFEQSCRADVGLVLLANDFGEPMVGASVKPFDYMACGLPLLVNGTPEWKSFFEAAGVAISCDPESADDIARAITWMHDNPEARITMGKKGQKMIRTVWNYETQFAQVIEALNGIQPAQGFGESR